MSAILVGPLFRPRPMTITDLDAIMEIEPLAYPYPWTKGIFRDCIRVGYCCWCYETDDVINGYGVMSVAAGESHILNLTVNPDYQRQGIGYSMLEYFLQLARRHHAEVTMLEVRPSNHAAIALYEKLGFNEIGSRPNYYPLDNGREDALLFALNL